MMDIYIMQYNYRSGYLVVINGNAYVSVYKYEKDKFVQPFLSSQAKFIFIGKSRLCEMTEFSGALNNPDFDGNTILLEFEDSIYVYNSGFEIFEFRISDKIILYLSLMGNIMTPSAFTVGEKYTHFIYNRFKFLKMEELRKVG